MKQTYNELLNNFKLYLTEEEKADATIEKYIRDVKKLFQFILSEPLTKEIVLNFKKQLMDSYAPVSVNSILSSINSFFDFIKSPSLKVKMIKIQKQIFSDKNKELTKDEYMRLLNAAKSHKNEILYYLMQTICSSGIRVSELKYITFESVKDGYANIRNKGKLRCVLLPSKLCKILKNYAKAKKISSGALFVSKTGKPLDRSQIWKMMKALCTSAKVNKEKVFPHNLRHLFARTYYSIQKDIVRLADILGHSNINTTRIYTMEPCDVHIKQIQSLGLLI